jgi:hypothetical protein
MKRNNRKTRAAAGPDDHIDTLGELLTQLRTHLTEAAEKKGTWSDYLRLLEFYRQTRETSPREIFVHWVESENAGDID